MTDTVSIKYDLGSNGWSNFDLTIGDQSVHVGSFSYTTNALDDLIRLGIMVCTSAYRAEASFDGEPNEWRIIAKQIGHHSDPLCLNVRVLEFDDIYDHAPEENGRKIFEARTNSQALARAIHDAAEDVWEKYGAERYAEVWMGYKGFPLRALKALKAALATQDPPGRDVLAEIETSATQGFVGREEEV